MILLAALITGSTAAADTRQALRIVFDGRSEGSGRGISGTFAASAPLCAEGTFVDGTGSRNGTRIRVDRSLSCADGSGGVTVVYDGVVEFLDGSGRWWVASGRGRFADLRGTGSTSNVSITHDPQTGSGTFRNTFTGVAAFDAVPPDVVVTAASVRRISKRPPVQRLRVAFRAVDAAATLPLTYALHVVDPFGRSLHARTGTTIGTVATLTLRTRLRTRNLRFTLAVRDDVGNERLVTRSLPMR